VESTFIHQAAFSRIQTSGVAKNFIGRGQKDGFKKSYILKFFYLLLSSIFPNQIPLKHVSVASHFCTWIRLSSK